MNSNLCDMILLISPNKIQNKTLFLPKYLMCYSFFMTFKWCIVKSIMFAGNRRLNSYEMANEINCTAFGIDQINLNFTPFPINTHFLPILLCSQYSCWLHNTRAGWVVFWVRAPVIGVFMHKLCAFSFISLHISKERKKSVSVLMPLDQWNTQRHHWTNTHLKQRDGRKQLN